MKKIELLAPAGNMECLHAAIAAGCDAIYLGGNFFGARAYSKNFDNEELIEAINYSHLYGVKVYVTVNTLIYENETKRFLEYVEFLHKNNVDAIIIQDLGMMDLVRKTFPNLEIHASTQMHIHNLDGVKLMEHLGLKRVVLARETSIDEIIRIKKETNIDLEIFIHGALCISYSGQCLMSSLIGGRSGNRGTCAGSCRLKYDIVDSLGNKLNKDDYPLSTKDLYGIESIKDLIENNIASLKIEGRMKSKEYVYTVVSLYREAIDSYYKYHKVAINKEKLLKLKKIFNRNYTKGFLNNIDNSSLINGYRPNHMGLPVGKIIDYKNNIATIKLIDSLSIGDCLRVLDKSKDVGIIVNDFYQNGKLIKEAKANDIISIKVNSPVSKDSEVVLTQSKKITDEIEEIIKNNPRKVEITGNIIARENKPLTITFSDNKNTVTVSSIKVSKALNKPTTKEEIIDKLNRLGNTIYKLSKIEFDIDNNIFIPIKELNNLRRDAIQKLNDLRLYQIPFIKKEYTIKVPNFKKEKNIAILIKDSHSIPSNYDIIYSEKIVPNTIQKLPRVIKEYPSISSALVGEIGALNSLKDVYTDFSLNVTNSYTVAFLHSLGAKRITLSYELSDENIQDLINAYHKRYKCHPNLELIIEANEEVMISKYSIPAAYKNNNLYLRDTFNNLYKIKEKDGLMYIYNYKRRKLNNPRYYDMGLNSLRINE